MDPTNPSVPRGQKRGLWCVGIMSRKRLVLMRIMPVPILPSSTSAGAQLALPAIQAALDWSLTLRPQSCMRRWTTTPLLSGRQKVLSSRLVPRPRPVRRGARPLVRQPKHRSWECRRTGGQGEERAHLRARRAPSMAWQEAWSKAPTASTEKSGSGIHLGSGAEDAQQGLTAGTASTCAEAILVREASQLDTRRLVPGIAQPTGVRHRQPRVHRGGFCNATMRSTRMAASAGAGTSAWASRSRSVRKCSLVAPDGPAALRIAPSTSM